MSNVIRLGWPRSKSCFHFAFSVRHIHDIMHAQPVKRYRKPAYPTRLEVLSQPKLLERHVPASWRAMPEITGVVALFLAANTNVQSADKNATGAAAVVAPIFEHGNGRGAIGCVVVAPPVFLSEEEAWQVIDQELERSKIKIGTKQYAIPGVAFPQRMLDFDPKENKSYVRKVEGTRMPYLADRADPQKSIAVEFVSQADFRRLGGVQSSSSVQDFDLKGLGKSVAKTIQLDAKDKIYFGVLYDPAYRPEYKDVPGINQEKPKRDEVSKLPDTREDLWARRQAVGKAESRRLLRQQVRDFVKWLQGQGAI